jgi:large subunit ribosomal protein L32
MGVPKRRVSKSRKNKRRSMWLKIAAPTINSCPRCHSPKMPHRVCPECGYYRDREVISEAE